VRVVGLCEGCGACERRKSADGGYSLKKLDLYGEKEDRVIMLYCNMS
jgi:hypothetical protein